MKIAVTALLPLLILSAAFAQDPPAPATAPPQAAAGTEAAAVQAAPESEPAPEPADAGEEAASYRLILYFEENGLGLTPKSSAALDSMSALFARGKRNRFEVHGYTCPAAGKGRVARHSAQRVEKIVDYLMEIGVPGAHIVTIVNAPKAAAAGECADDRQVDIVSAGAQWREQERAAEPPKPAASEEMAAVMDSLRRKLAEAESAPHAPPAPEPAPAEAPAPKAAAPDSGKQIVAVYMAGQEPPAAKGVHNIMGGELARVMSESDKYTAVDRTEAILEQLDKEHVYQRSGAVDDEQIKAIGHQLGVQYLCISNINPVGRRYYLDTRLVDIVTAEIKRSVTATSTLKDAEEMARVGRNIALELLEAEKTRRQRLLKKKIFRYTAIGLDVLGAGILAYGYYENDNVVKHTKATSVEKVDGIDRTNMADGPEADRAATRRNVAYIIGGALGAAGVTIHIAF